jgi:hypothetical protein
LGKVPPYGQRGQIPKAQDRSRPEPATINASFAWRKRIRIELYLDGGDKDENKERLEKLLARKSEIEQIVGEPIEWERMDNRRACRIAVFTKAQILTDADSSTLLEWAAKRAVYFYEAFGPEFLSSRAVASE